MEFSDRSFLGRGWSFPPTFKENDLTIEMVSAEEDIRQSLFILISTIPGERLMKPEYGCDLHRMVFKKLNNTTRVEIVEMVKMAILKFEPRITVEEVEVSFNAEDLGLMYITVDYTVRLTNTRSNIVYPYYINEGTNVTKL